MKRIRHSLPEIDMSGANWSPDNDATPSPREVEAMAAVLEGRHGALAADVADFLSAVHGQRGDAGRCWAWAGVAELVRQRTNARIHGRA